MSQVTAVQLFYRVADRNKVAKFPKKHLFRSPFYAKSSLKQVSSKHFQKPFLTALGKCFHYLETFENCNKFPISNRLTIDRIIRPSKPPTLYRIRLTSNSKKGFCSYYFRQRYIFVNIRLIRVKVLKKVLPKQTISLQIFKRLSSTNFT